MSIADGQSIASVARQLRDNEVHVWRLPYRREQRRGPLLQLLGAYLGIPGDNVVLVEGDFGRPALDPAHGMSLGFNWSHSGDCALIAIGRQLVPGIDIERRRVRVHALDIAERYFCRDEWAALASLTPEARGETFLRLWTAKEAVLKALGRGIAFGLDRLHVVSEGGRIVLQWLDDDDALAWQLQPLDVGGSYWAALAWRGGARQVRYWTVENQP